MGATDLSTSEANSRKARKRIPGPFVHHVLFWLKKPDDKLVRARFKESLSDLVYNCETVRSADIGVPADTSRPVIDSSYTFSLIVTFDDKEGHDIYQAHPLHLKFINDSSELWERVQIYDSEPV